MSKQKSQEKWRMPEYACPDHQAAGVSLSYALALSSDRTWSELITTFEKRLTVSERKELAGAVLNSLSSEDASITVQSMFEYRGAGAPDAPLYTFQDQAMSWVSWADPEEINVYCLACFEKMPIAQQREFLQYTQELDAT